MWRKRKGKKKDNHMHTPRTLHHVGPFRIEVLKLGFELLLLFGSFDRVLSMATFDLNQTYAQTKWNYEKKKQKPLISVYKKL